MIGYEDEDEVPDWESREEEVPEPLKKKWRERELARKEQRPCQACGELVDQDGLLCLYCGKATGAQAGFLSRLRTWFLKSYLGIVVLLLLMSIIILFLVF